jgi:phospholipid/cholesterol/gamma-HCH transport system substrate-binding protein
VRYNGIDAGRVTDLRFDPNDPGKVLAKLQVKPNLHIRQDSEASIESQGLTGGSYVEISGGTKKSPELTAPPGQIPVIKSSPSTLQQLEESAPELFDKLNHAADKINKLLSDDNVKNFSGLLASFNATGKNLETITTPLARRSAEMDAMIVNLARASAKVGPTLADADDSIRKFGKLSSDADIFVNGEGLNQLTDLLRETRGLVASLTRLSNELDRQPTKLLFGDRHKGYTPK